MKRRGAVLVFTLAVLTGILAILATAAAMQRYATQATINRLDKIRAQRMADSAIQLALNTLSTQSVSSANQSDAWYSLGSQGQDNFKLDDGTFRLQVLDAGSFVNLNTATSNQLQNLPLTQEQIDSLLDFVQAGTQARADGAKDDYYNGLTNAYNAALAPLASVDEVLQIKGFTPATLFAPGQSINNQSATNASNGDVSYQPVLYDMVTVDSASTNNTPQGRPKTLIRNVTRQSLLQLGIPSGLATTIYNRRTSLTTLGAVLRLPGAGSGRVAQQIIDNLTTSTTAPTGKININTANQGVLETVPNLPTDAVQGILSMQANSGFSSLGAITQVAGMTGNTLAQTIDDFTTNSTSFIVRVIGSAGGIDVPEEAIVTITGTTAKAIKIIHPPYDDMTVHWHWDAQPNNDVDLTTASQ